MADELTVQEQLEQLRAENEKLRTAVEAAPKAKVIDKPWLAIVYNAKGVIQAKIDSKGKSQDLIKGFDKSSDADRWLILRLVEGKPGWYAEITHAYSKTKETITRDDAIARAAGRKTYPVTHSKGYRLGESLGFKWKVKESRSTFSKG